MRTSLRDPATAAAESTKRFIEDWKKEKSKAPPKCSNQKKTLKRFALMHPTMTSIVAVPSGSSKIGSMYCNA